jgi:transposase
VARAYPRRDLHVVVDNLSTHKHPTVHAWLARHRRVTLHFTPTSGSRLNLVEAFFSIITRQSLRRGNFSTVADLIAAAGRSPGPRTPTPSSPRPPDPRHRKTPTTSVTEH